MATTLTQPTIPGFAGEVGQFADEQGITDIAFAIHQVAWRLFPMAAQIRLELHEDPEDSEWRYLEFVIDGLPISPTEACQIDQDWIAEVTPVCPAEQAWLFSHDLRFAE